jgi:hypothetical protein
MNGNEVNDMAVHVLRDRIDHSIEVISELTPVPGMSAHPTAKLCAAHSSAIIVGLQCWKYSLTREIRIARYSAVGGVLGGILAGVGYAFLKWFEK